MNNPATALGFFELKSIAKGFWLADAVVKKAPVQVIAAEPTSSGKFVLLFMGDIASVEESHREGKTHAEDCLIRDVFIPALDEQIPPFLEAGFKTGWQKLRKPVFDSVAIVESTSMADTVLSCDAALKTASAVLSRMHLGSGIGGHGFFVLSGNLSDLEASIDCARAVLLASSTLVRTELIARPQEEAFGLF